MNSSRPFLYPNPCQFGVLGPGKEIHCPLDFGSYGSLEFVEQFVRMMAYRNDGSAISEFGDDIAEGFVRAAQKWGRLEGDEGDLKTGLLHCPAGGWWIIVTLGLNSNGVMVPSWEIETERA